ncbi:hypothetical protein [Paenibacillus sp.]|uniref:hypothetical protein n=1 Tax=Paenibacillus sp. TaxID=58172 RepID=UPI0035638B39
MDPIDKELKQELSDGPFAQDGFTDALRKRIEERIMTAEAPSSPTVRRIRPWLASAGAAAAAALLFLAVEGDRWFMPPASTLDSAPMAATASQVVPDFESTVRTALLVGLRTDTKTAEPTEEKSEYRTLLIAPDDSRLKVISQGPGILMPYKMDFWRLREARTVNGEGRAYVYWSAALAASSRSADQSAKQVAALSNAALTEKLLFVGNRYIAVEQKVMTRDKKGDLRSSRFVWVKDVPQLAGASNPDEPPLQQPHVKLKDIFGTAVEPALQQLDPYLPLMPSEFQPKHASTDTWGESWTIARQQGRWIAKVASYENDASGDSQSYRLKDVPMSLPAEVVSHDRLVPEWGEIKRIQPAAVDAYSSPNLDVVLVVANRHLIVYPYKGVLLPNPLLTVELKPQESVIMAHWATDPYIDPWKKNVSAFLTQ